MNFAMLARLGLDNSGFKTSLTESQKASKGFAKSVTSVFAKVAAALGGVALGKNMVRLAMDAEEVASKFNTVLGPSAEGVNQKINELLKTIPATRAELQNTIATVAQMGMAFGMSEEAAANFSVGMTKIAGDLASFHNMRPEEVFTKLQAAITGEFEPLKRLGIVINEATLKQKALSLGLSDGVSKLDAQTKAITVQNIVLDQMGAALGDSARTQNSSANQTKFFKAKIVELQTEIGQRLIPVTVKFLEILSPLVKFISLNIDATLKFTRRIIAFTIGVKAASKIMPIFGKNILLYSRMAKMGASSTAILTLSLRKLALAIKSVLASTGIGLLVVALSEVGMMAMNAATKTGQATDDMTDDLSNLEKDIEDTMRMVNESTQAYKIGSEAQLDYAESSETISEAKEREAREHEELTNQIGTYFKKVREAINAEQDRFILAKEMESLQLRAKGEHAAADALDAQIAKAKEAIAIARKYNLHLFQAQALLKKLDKNKRVEATSTPEGQSQSNIADKEKEIAELQAMAAKHQDEAAASREYYLNEIKKIQEKINQAQESGNESAVEYLKEQGRLIVKHLNDETIANKNATANLKERIALAKEQLNILLEADQMLGLEKKIKDMKLEALRKQADGDKKAQESLEQRVKLAERIVGIMKEFNVSQEEATRLANADMEIESSSDSQSRKRKSESSFDFQSEKRSVLTGHDLRKAANLVGKGKGEDGKDIRFEKMSDGTFQQFIGGRKGERFTEGELQKGLQKQIDNLKKSSNIVGEGKGEDGKETRFQKIGDGTFQHKGEDGKENRFQKMGDGTFQQFIGGRKGKKFTEDELQKGLQKQIDKESNTENLLEKINTTLEGKFVSQ